jgi:FtsP/CotA-like multicopper oxidase with cupredoxin domain
MKKTITFLILAITILFSCREENIVTLIKEDSQDGLREYFIAAEEVEWDYAPQNINLITNAPFSSDELVFMKNDTNRIGRVYLKARYKLYTDNTYSIPTIIDEEPELGILGPVIRAEVGDKIKVYFKNKTKFPVSMHPHGVKYDSNNEGITGVLPDDSFVYEWDVTEQASPGPADGSSILWMYHSHVTENNGQDIYAGLVGPLVVYKKGMLEDNKAKDVDEEKFAFFSVFDENASLYLESNIARYTSKLNPNIKDDPDFQESNKMHSVNGLMFGHQQFSAALGEKVRWYVFDLGNEVDWHTAHWHGNTTVSKGSREDVVSVGPANMLVADMDVENAGNWQFHCHVHDHMVAAGMISLYDVK